jgi:hypothetical protein
MFGWFKKSDQALRDEIVFLESRLKDSQGIATARTKEADQLQKEHDKLEEELKVIKEQLLNATQGMYTTTTKKKYTSPKDKVKKLGAKALGKVREALDKVPNGAQLQGHCIVYDKKSKKIKLVEVSSKDEALRLIDKADKGDVTFIF